MASFHYQLGTFTKEQYDALEVSLCDADDSTYVDREVEQTDDILHSETRGVFWLSEEEAAELEKDPQIKFIHKDPDRYPDDYPQPPEDELHCAITDTYRYNEPVKHHPRFKFSSDFPRYGSGYNPNNIPQISSADLRRCGYQLLRTTRENGPKTKSDIWASETTVASANIKKYGTGKDVDIVCMDNGTWIGHIEFINNRPVGESPTDYIGGNVLPGNGICDVLDLVLDGPYYIDPDWFNAVGSRLTTRWDGTTVPTESAARNWWGSTSNRSAQFQSYGTVTVSSNYTRLNAHGDFNTSPYSGTHGTQCASQIYGRTHGWAYNCNKWQIDGFSGRGLGLTKVWDVQKIFHLAKPINPKYGTKDPTLSSNSWGYRASPSSSGWAYHRTSAGIRYTTQATEPRFMRYVGHAGDGGRMKSEFRDSSIVTSAKEMVDAGVITVIAAGNSTQKQTRWNHPDYDNYWHTSSSGHFGDNINVTQFGYNVMPTINRPGFPQHAGADWGDPKTFNITVTASGASAYTMTGTDRNGSVSGNNPTITIHRGDTINFNVNAGGHPFYIKTVSSTGTTNQVQYPTASNQGSTNGTVTWSPNQRTPSDTTGVTFRYNCSTHLSMNGPIVVKSGNRTNPTINIGALDDEYASGNKERKVNYSDMGEAINCFSPADGSLAACPPNPSIGTIDIVRYEYLPVNSPEYLSKNGNTTWSDGQTGSPLSSRDCRFSGTSSACPIACGLIATVVEFNRNWTEADIKTWLATLQNQNTTTDFHDIAEETTADGTGHSDLNALQGATARVIYQGGTYGHSTKEITSKEIKLASSISITGSLGLTRK